MQYGYDPTYFKYIHKRRGFRKAGKAQEKAPEPEQQKPITEDLVNDYINNPEIVSNWLRNERALRAQRKQMNARSLLTNAF